MRVIKTKDRSKLIQAAMGKIPCDLTIGNVQFLNVITGEIYPASVDILAGFVVLVREEGQEPVLPAAADISSPASSTRMYMWKAP